jgi:hypothetical protein
MSKGRSPPPKSPQEKKALSYANDTRNVYGNNNKAARKAIPARKAGENRKSRHKAAQVIKITLNPDDAIADTTESSLRHDLERVGGWTKSPDMRLGEFLKRQVRQRLSRNPKPRGGGS